VGAAYALIADRRAAAAVGLEVVDADAAGDVGRDENAGELEDRVGIAAPHLLIGIGAADDVDVALAGEAVVVALDAEAEGEERWIEGEADADGVARLVVVLEVADGEEGAAHDAEHDAAAHHRGLG